MLYEAGCPLHNPVYFPSPPANTSDTTIMGDLQEPLPIHQNTAQPSDSHSFQTNSASSNQQQDRLSPAYSASADISPAHLNGRFFRAVRLRDEILQFLAQDRDLLDWFLTVTSSPLTLKQLCRISIRAHLQQKLRAKCNYLPLPPLMRKYIMFQ